MLRCGPSLRTFEHFTAFRRLKRRYADTACARNRSEDLMTVWHCLTMEPFKRGNHAGFQSDFSLYGATTYMSRVEATFRCIWIKVSFVNTIDV